VGTERKGDVEEKGEEESTTSELERRLGGFGQELPKAWKVLEGHEMKGCKKVVVIGVHGWFPGAIVRTVLGEVRIHLFVSYIFLTCAQPTGTSTKFASMMGLALEEFQREYGVEFEKITLVPLEGEGTIEKRVEKYVVICALSFSSHYESTQAIRQSSLKPGVDEGPA
jgi:hypothetical protein